MSEQAADLVFTNGAIYTVDARRNWSEALAILGGRIVFVGPSDGARAYTGSGTEVVDLKGKMVLPGFFDSHLHPVEATSLILSADLHGLQTSDECLAAVMAYAQANPDAPVIRGAGWSNTSFPIGGPRTESLDSVVPDRPAALRSEDGHSLWVNSNTLAMADITAETPDPPGGVIERDPDSGVPRGTLREAAMELVEGVIPDFNTAEEKVGLLAFQEMAAQRGVTSVLDAHSSGSVKAYKELEAEGALTVRYRGSLLVEPDDGLDRVEALVAERARHKGRKFQARAAKIFVDGVVEGETAYLLEPYAHRPKYRGELLWDPRDLNRMCAALDREGFQIHIHAIGDAAVRISLDAIEQAQVANGPRDARHLITHLQLVHPDDIPRFAQLGVVGLPQPFWFAVTDYFWNLEVPYLGRERAAKEYPMRSLIEAGAILASASDFPVTVDFSPVVGMQMGVTRSFPGKLVDPDLDLQPGQWGVLGPSERVSLADMVASFTINGAYANFLEAETGSLEPGKAADLVVLDRNLFAVPETEVSQTKVLMTMLQGEVVYRAAGF
jgi:predicted amidohydrolase YtcJ